MGLLLKCEHVGFGYENQDAVLDVNLEVNEGDYICIVGENGSGKSTLMKGILGLLKPTSGRIEYSEELKELIENNKRNVFKNIREVVSINLSTQIINRLYDSFMNSNSYTYKAVTKYNIPYAMLYYQQSISLYGQYIVKGIFGDLLSDQINEKSRFFKVENTGEIVKNVTGYRTINMMFKQFKATGNEKTITMEIYETDEEDRVYTILKEKISLKSYIYR